jgi:hypothetical protein
MYVCSKWHRAGQFFHDQERGYMMRMNTQDRNKLYETLRQELASIHLVDAHSHLPSEEAWLSWEEDFTSLLGYAMTDLVNAGLSRDEIVIPLAGDDRWRLDYGYDYIGDTRSIEEKWKAIKPYWRYVRHIGSAHVTRTTLRMFFDCDDFDDATIPTIQNRIKELKKPGTYRQVIKEKSKIDAVCNVVQSIKECPATDVLAPQLYTDTFATIQKRRDIYRLQQAANQEIYSLTTYLRALDTMLEEAVRQGLIGIKWHVFPYLRDMQYDVADTYEAAKCLDKILQMPARGGSGSSTAVGFDEMRPFQDLIQNHLVERAIELDIPVQIHAATLGASYGGPLQNGNPTALVSLFLRYPQARFNILHASFPFSRELGAIAHLFPNVYINCSWFDILSPQSYKLFLKDWLTGMPFNKIFAFGADQFNVFHVGACAERVRDLVAEVLTDLVAEGDMAESDAVFIADCILRKNAWEHWKLEKRLSVSR